MQCWGTATCSIDLTIAGQSEGGEEGPRLWRIWAGKGGVVVVAQIAHSHVDKRQ